MIQSKREFFKNGVDNQKRPDIVVDIKRKELKCIRGWNTEDRQLAMDFLRDAQKTIETIIDVIKTA